MKIPTTSGTIPEGDIPRFIASATRMLPPGSLIIIAVPRGESNDIHLHGCVGAALGDVKNYVEPFAGSAAVLMRRPGDHKRRFETINDIDGFVANFWRALQRDPDAVAEHADNPVNECDLHARHIWLVNRRDDITGRLMGDPDWFDAKAAGWWVWGQCSWIAGGWCSGNGKWGSVDGVIAPVNGEGVRRQRPHLGDAGRGINRQRQDLVAYMRSLADRLRHVRVCCGSWDRVTGPSPTTRLGETGVFLDPPYAAEADRDPGCYAVDCLSVAHSVREWAIEAAKHPDMKIILCGYEGEHQMPDSWHKHEWSANGGYGGAKKDSKSITVNRHKERIWFSPACRIENSGLFADNGAGNRATKRVFTTAG